MKTLKCIIIDDEKPARRLIENYCNRIELDVVGDFKSPLDALPLLENSTIDLIFLDIRMPEISGIDFLKTLNHKPYIILTTAYREYALDAFELDVTDYLLKPIEFPRFLKAINKIQKKPVQVHQELKEPKNKNQFITVKSNKRLYKVPFEDILYIQSDNEYITFVTQSHGKLMVHGALKNIEKELPSSFWRIHRSFIINSLHIKYVEGNRVLIQDSPLTISESYRKAFFEHWNTL